MYLYHTHIIIIHIYIYVILYIYIYVRGKSKYTASFYYKPIIYSMLCKDVCLTDFRGSQKISNPPWRMSLLRALSSARSCVLATSGLNTPRTHQEPSEKKGALLAAPAIKHGRYPCKLYTFNIKFTKKLTTQFSNFLEQYHAMGDPSKSRNRLRSWWLHFLPWTLTSIWRLEIESERIWADRLICAAVMWWCKSTYANIFIYIYIWVHLNIHVLKQIYVYIIIYNIHLYTFNFAYWFTITTFRICSAWQNFPSKNVRFSSASFGCELHPSLKGFYWSSLSNSVVECGGISGTNLYTNKFMHIILQLYIFWKAYRYMCIYLISFQVA